MKKSFLSLLLVGGLITSSFAQKTISDANVQKRNVSGFHGIEVSTGIELTLTKGSSEEVAVSASEIEFRDKIVTEVVNGILKIRYETKTGAINRKNENKKLLNLKNKIICIKIRQIINIKKKEVKTI